MNIEEAYSILDMKAGATAEEIKKKYKQLSKKYHPDINKELGSEDKFKEINQAYQLLTTTPKDKGIFRKHYQPSLISLELSIDFKDAVYGTKREVSYKRTVKCQNCSGEGHVPLNNGCSGCAGKGQITVRQGSMIFITSCQKCHGKFSYTECRVCNSGMLESEVSISVKIPGGVIDGNVLRLAGMGNYAGQFFGQDQFTDVSIKINVSSQSGLTLSGDSVIFKLNITLAEAVMGCEKSVNTVEGLKKISIKNLSRHNDEVIIPNMGVNKVGHQKVILDVQYPDNITDLINKGES